MTDEKKPNRFSMIAEEMTVGVEPKVIETPGLLVSGDSVTCSRCGLGAFEPALARLAIANTSVAGVPSVVCLGCPDNPWYPLPVGLKLGTSRYRCGGCGKQSQVTMTLSDVNVHCIGCGKLTLHVKQVSPTPSLNKKSVVDETYENALINFGDGSDGASVFDGAAGMTYRSFGRKSGGGGGEGDGGWIRAAVAKKRVTSEMAVVDRMREKLGLEDFDAFAARSRDANVNAVLRGDYAGDDVDRRTGRTTRGLLEALARCAMNRHAQLWVRGGNPRIDDYLRNEATTLRLKLELEFPREIKFRVGLSDRRRLEPDDVRVYVDHTCDG